MMGKAQVMHCRSLFTTGNARSSTSSTSLTCKVSRGNERRRRDSRPFPSPREGPQKLVAENKLILSYRRVGWRSETNADPRSRMRPSLMRRSSSRMLKAVLAYVSLPMAVSVLKCLAC
jgi:hypothetical protein